MKQKTSRKKFKEMATFRLAADLAAWLDTEAERLGKTKTRILEEALRTRMAFKPAAN